MTTPSPTTSASCAPGLRPQPLLLQHQTRDNDLDPQRASLHPVAAPPPSLTERLDFARRTDDAQSLSELHRAHVVILGISRTGKTTTCQALASASDGLLAANVPILSGRPLPREVLDLPDNVQVIVLVAQPRLIRMARRARCDRNQGLDPEYADLGRIRSDLIYALHICDPSWPVVDVSGKSATEVASEIIRLCGGR